MIVARLWGCLPDDLIGVDGTTYRLMLEQLADEADQRRKVS